MLITLCLKMEVNLFKTILLELSIRIVIFFLGGGEEWCSYIGCYTSDFEANHLMTYTKDATLQRKTKFVQYNTSMILSSKYKDLLFIGLTNHWTNTFHRIYRLLITFIGFFSYLTIVLNVDCYLSHLLVRSPKRLGVGYSSINWFVFLHVLLILFLWISCLYNMYSKPYPPPLNPQFQNGDK